MDVVFLSRLQFAAAAYFHFLFVPLTLGLAMLVAIMETKYVRTGDQDYLRMTKFWGKLFVINFAVGVVTGITLEFQFGTNWSRYSAYVGDIFGSLLAIEATVAFFLESTFIGIWIFGWKKLSAKAHAACIWVVALASSVSAYWILSANAWMQHPVGYEIRNGRAELTDFWAVISQPFAFHTFIHTVSAAYLLGGFFVMAISAYHLLKKNETRLFTKSFKLAATWSLVLAVIVVVHGHYNGSEVARVQPTKLAAMEAHWETQKNAPIYALVIPGTKESEKNVLEFLPLPGFLSLLAYHDASAEVKGLKEWPVSERPPVFLSFVSFRTMVALGMLMLLMSFLAFWWRNRLDQFPWYLKLQLYALPLPWLAIQLGWTLTEVGRQPWIVYGMMKTSDAASPIAASQVATTLAAFVILYSLLALIDIFLITKYARRGPEPARAE